MATKPNYGFEKRQRELEKKRKKEEKAQRKASLPDATPPGETALGQMVKRGAELGVEYTVVMRLSIVGEDVNDMLVYL